MKNITRRIVALLASAVTAITTLSVSYSEAFAETPQDSSTSSADTDYEVNPGGLLGTLMPEEFRSLSEENEEAQKSENVIYKLDYDNDMENIIIDYSAQTDSNIFIGFYNDEGTQLYTSVTVDVAAGVNTQTVIKKPDGLPSYYLIKAFMVGQFSEPLTKPYVFDKCTEAVSAIIEKKADDFDSKKVVKFDENDMDNFIVTKEEHVTIYSDDVKDTFLEQNGEYEYVFENIDKIKTLSEGQTVLVYTPQDILLFVIDSIKIDGSKAVVTKAPFLLDDLVSFIKIDSSLMDEEQIVTVDDYDHDVIDSYEVIDRNSSPSQSTENGITRKSAPDMTWVNDYIPSISHSVRFNMKKEEEINNSSVHIGAYLELGLEFEIEVYYDSVTNTNSIGGTFGAYVEVGLEAGVSKSIPIPGIKIGNIAISFSVVPIIHIRATIALKHRMTWAFDFGYRKNEEFSSKRDLSEPIPDEKSLTFEISIGFDTGINVLSKNIFRVSIEPEVGRRWEYTNANDQNNDYTHHDCTGKCMSMIASVFLTCSWHVKAFGIELVGEGDDTKIGDVKEYDIIGGDIVESPTELKWETDVWHFKNGTRIEGPCDNLSHKIILHVKESKNNSENSEEVTTVAVKDATVYEGKFVSSDSKFIDENEDAILSDKNGNIELWINDEKLLDKEYCVTVKTPDNKACLVRVGKNWNPNLNMANEYDVIIDDKSQSVDPEAEESYPLRGNCGIGTPSMIDPNEVSYDPVEYLYYSNGECDIWGYGTLDCGRLSDALYKRGINSIERLEIGNNVKISGSLYNNIHIDTVEFLGGNGEVLSGSFMQINGVKEIITSDFEKIGSSAFMNWYNLEKIELPYNLKEIGHEAFWGCSGLKNVDLPSNLEIIGDCAFQSHYERTNSIQEIVCPKKLTSIGIRAFQDNTGLKTVVLNNGLKIIKDSAFESTGIKSISIPSSVELVEIEAFRDCYNLKTVIINGNFETKDCIVFNGSPVETVIMNDGVTDVCSKVFSSIPTLKNVRFSKNLEKIGFAAFENASLTHINLPDSLQTIGEAAFSGAKINDLTIPKNVKTIEDRAFAGNPITKLILPEGLEKIGSHAFGGFKFKSITIPNSVNEIGAYAFNNGSYINDIKLDISSINELSSITILNPNCNLEENFVSNATTIYGYTGSTAETYAHAKGNLFKALDAPAVTTTTAATTTGTTTTTAVVSAKVAPSAECVCIAVKDEDTVNGSADEILDKENVKFFDQKAADSDGVVSFSYLPDEKEKWAFIFVSEAINDTITKAFGTPDDLKTTTYNVAPGVKGDANGDGEIDMSDVVLIMQALANPNKYGVEGTDPKHITVSGFGYADSDGDGLTVNDALRIQQYLLGLIPSLT